MRKSEMLNVECSMLNVEWPQNSPVAFPFNIQHSTLNIQHSVLQAEAALATL